MFFSSPHAVAFFFNLVDSHWFINKKVGCIGEGTRKALTTNGIIPHFSGKGSVEEVATKFSQIIKVNQVLFPRGKESRRTVQSKLLPKQVKEIVIYETKYAQSSINENLDAVVFTSPSNVLSYLKNHGMNINPRIIIAIGSSTSQELCKYQIPHLISKKPTELDLAERLIGAL